MSLNNYGCRYGLPLTTEVASIRPVFLVNCWDRQEQNFLRVPSGFGMLLWEGLFPSIDVVPVYGNITE